MAKYRKKSSIVSAVLFEEGMEDGYVSRKIFTNEFIGIFKKGEPVPKANNFPAINIGEKWYEVEEDKHYIVTDENGERYVVEKEVFEESHELVDEVYEDMFRNMSQNSSIYGTEGLEYLLKCLKYKVEKM